MGLIVVVPPAASFLPSGMNKNGTTQEIPNSTFTQMTGWVADAAFPGSTLSGNALVNQSNSPGATLGVEWNVQNSGFASVTVEVQFRVGGAQVGTTQSFSVDAFATQIRTASVTGIPLVQGDLVTAWARGVSGGGTRTLHSGWLRITQP